MTTFQPSLLETSTSDEVDVDLDAVNILPDKAGRVGALSYLVPRGMNVDIGDAVQVPFGKRTKVGLVVGEGDPDKATRPIAKRHGPRSGPGEVAAAQQLARRHFVDLARMAPRLGPTSGKGATPVDDSDVELACDTTFADTIDIPDDHRRRYLLRAPLVDPAHLAAWDAARIHEATGGQVLILCPSVALVTRVLKSFESGARRLDTKASYGAWKGFRAGTVTIGVGTRRAALYAGANVTGVVVVEEAHPGHVERSMPYTHARTVAALRADEADLHLTLIGNRPSPPSLGLKVRVHPVDGDGWPDVTVVDRSTLPPERRTEPSKVLRAARRAAEQGTPASVVVERLEAIRRCDGCSTPRTCPSCERTGRAQSTCRHPLGRCQRCGSERTWVAGWDEPRVRELFARNRVQVRPVTFLDLQDAHDLGTVIVMDIDRALTRSGFDPEKMPAQLLLSAAQAAGPGGRLVVCTSDASKPLVADLLVNRDPVAAAKRVWESAKGHGYPPFSTMVTVSSPRKPVGVGQWPGRVFGPKRRGSEWEAVVLLDHDELDRFEPVARQLRSRGKVRIDVQ